MSVAIAALYQRNSLIPSKSENAKMSHPEDGVEQQFGWSQIGSFEPGFNSYDHIVVFEMQQ
jgi:hypothetical protein